MGFISKHAVAKSQRTAWFHFIDGCELLLRYLNPDEREKLLDAAQEKTYDVKQGKQIEKISTAKLAAQMREFGVVRDWRLSADVLPQLVDLLAYPEPGTMVPFDAADCEHLITHGEGLGSWLLDNIRALSAFQEAEAAARKNGLSPTPSTPSGSATAQGDD